MKIFEIIWNINLDVRKKYYCRDFREEKNEKALKITMLLQCTIAKTILEAN